MKFFVDTADIKEITEMNDTGLLDGVTTNPSLIMKSGRDILEVTKEICQIVEGPVSAEVTATEHDEGSSCSGKDCRQYLHQAATDPGRAESLQGVDIRWTQDQCHFVFFSKPGASGSKGRRDFRLALCRPAG